MSIFPPPHVPLRLQARQVRQVLLDDHGAHATNDRGGSGLFQPRAECLRGHPVTFEEAPHRLSCAECRQPLGRRAYRCRRCEGRHDWHCARCVGHSQHPMRRAAAELGAPALSGGGPDGKLRYVKFPLEVRRAAFQADAGRAPDVARLEPRRRRGHNQAAEEIPAGDAPVFFSALRSGGG